MAKNYINRQRLTDALMTFAKNDDVVRLEMYIKSLDKDEHFIKTRIFNFAIENCSINCVLFLIDKGAVCNIAAILRFCKFDIIDKVYDFIGELTLNEKFKSETSFPDKKSLLNRILDTDKMSEKRVEYLISLGDYFKASDISEYIERYFVKERPKYENNNLGALVRHIKLLEIGV